MSGGFEKLVAPEQATKILYLTITILLLLGLGNSFIQDDAFISFRYAQNLITGNGLTWNAGGENIEGYTNFLWVMMIAIVEAIGIDPVLGSMALSTLSAVGTMYFTYQLSLMLLQSRWFALLAVVVLGTNYSYSSYVTGGLETQLQAFLFVAAAYFTFCISQERELPSIQRAVWLSLLFSLSVLTRLDSILVCSVLFVFAVASTSQRDHPVRDRMEFIAYLTLPGLFIVGMFLLFKYIYYGGILPNTYYIKADGVSIETIERGLWYVWSFLRNYFLWPFLIFGIFALRKKYVQSNIWTILGIIFLWTVYVIKVGGDFMEYRFLVPVLPFVFILIARIIQVTKYSILQAGLVVLLFYGTLSHAMTFNGENGIESISQLNSHIVDENQNWRGIGIALGKYLSNSTNPVTIAVTAAGAIPYYSNLPTVDMLGINDKWIAKNGVKIGSLPGHARIAPLAYLQMQKVNLIIGHPKIVPIQGRRDRSLRSYFWIPTDTSLLPKEAKFIEIPLTDKYNVQVLYIKQHKHVDDVIKRYNLRAYR